jgi:hypothetical protein
MPPYLQKPEFVQKTALLSASGQGARCLVINRARIGTGNAGVSSRKSLYEFRHARRV